jgi:hypothetical protein
MIDTIVWKDIAEVELHDNQIIALKNMRVTIYNNIKELCATTDTYLIHKVSKLKEWAENNPVEVCRTKVIPQHRYKIKVYFVLMQ